MTITNSIYYYDLSLYKSKHPLLRQLRSNKIENLKIITKARLPPYIIQTV